MAEKMFPVGFGRTVFFPLDPKGKRVLRARLVYWKNQDKIYYGRFVICDNTRKGKEGKPWELYSIMVPSQRLRSLRKTVAALEEDANKLVIKGKE